MKQRFLRIGDELSDDVTVVVRGGLLVAEVLERDASRNHEIYGVFGISVFAARDLSVDELAQVTPLVRFAYLTLMRVGWLRAAGLTLEPTGRNVRHYDVTFADLKSGVAALLACEREVVENPYHEE